MKPPHPTQSPDFEQSYFGKYIYDLYCLFIEQGDQVHASRGLKCPTTGSSTLHYLSLNEPTSITEIAKALGLAHQLIAHRVEKLIKEDIVERCPDPNDGRRFELVLTEYGQQQAALLKDLIDEAEIVYADLCKEIGVDLPRALTDAFLALKRIPLHDRFARVEKENKSGRAS